MTRAWVWYRRWTARRATRDASSGMRARERIGAYRRRDARADAPTRRDDTHRARERRSRVQSEGGAR